MVAAFGLLVLFLQRTGCNGAPLLLGMMLGPLMEENLRRALLLSRGSASVFVERPISLTLLIVAALMIAFMIRGAWKERRAADARARADVDAAGA